MSAPRIQRGEGEEVTLRAAIAAANAAASPPKTPATPSSRANSEAEEVARDTACKSAGGHPHRVVSVSPQRAGELEVPFAVDGPAELEFTPEPLKPLEDIFITPRVLDARAAEAFSRSLRALAAEARDESMRLRDAISEAAARESQTARAARQLHERLSLGARILKAFQSQIDALEALIDRAQETQARAQALDSALEGKLDGFNARLRELEERITSRLDAGDARTAADAKRAEAAREHAREALAAHESAERRARDAAAAIHGLLAQEEQSRLFLADDLIAAARSADVLRAELDAPCARMEGMVEQTQQAIERLEALSPLREKVKALLDEVEPWRDLLLGDAGGAAAVRAERVRAALEQELRRLLGALAPPSDAVPPDSSISRAESPLVEVVRIEAASCHSADARSAAASRAN